MMFGGTLRTGAYILSALLVSQTASSLAVNQGGSLNNLTVRGDPEADALTGPDGPSIKDLTWKVWDSTWFTAMAGALVEKDPNAIKATFEDTGIGGGEPGEKTDKAKFFLHNALSEKKQFEIVYADVSSSADYVKSTKYWWNAGLQTAAIKMGAFLGCDLDKLSFGSPVDAYKMLTGKTAVLKNVEDEGEFLEHLRKSESQPVVIGTGADPNGEYYLKPWCWYAVKSVNESQEPAVIEYYVPNTDTEGDFVSYNLPDIFKSARKIVFPDE